MTHLRTPYGHGQRCGAAMLDGGCTSVIADVDCIACLRLALLSPWRSVATDPPPPDNNYLTAGGNPDLAVAYYTNLTGDGFRWLGADGEGRKTPLWWMPIPPVPEKG